MKRVAIIGSTGSIGTNTLNVIQSLPDQFEAYALAMCKNVDLLEAQIQEFSPSKICVWDDEAGSVLQGRIGNKHKILSGKEGLLELVDDPQIDIYVFSLSGTNGIEPLLAAIKKGKRIAIANKEPLVIAGNLIREYAETYGAEIIPIDSEHSAIFQCLSGHPVEEIEELIITASGGPFFSRTKETFKDITPDDALRHPKWDMGRKISIDSATMVNKALELIEATTLFGIEHNRIKIVIHPEALIHSMVQFIDGGILAQISLADMRLPIQYALTYPNRIKTDLTRIDFQELSSLTFHKPDVERFPAIALGYRAAEMGGTLPAVLNATDEVCVEAFLQEKISFLNIVEYIETIMNKHTIISNPQYDDIMAADAWAREEARGICLI